MGEFCTVSLPGVNPAFVGLRCTETLMKYQMTPKYKFNGFLSTGMILCSSYLTVVSEVEIFARI